MGLLPIPGYQKLFGAKYLGRTLEEIKQRFPVQNIQWAMFHNWYDELLGRNDAHDEVEKGEIFTSKSK